MRVLAVAQRALNRSGSLSLDRHRLLTTDEHHARHSAGLEHGAFVVVAREVLGDRGVVGRGVAEGFAAERPTNRIGHRALVLPEGGPQASVVVGVDDHRDAGPVLRRSPNHGRTADVDVLDRRLEAAIGLRDDLRERVEVHDDEVDGRDVMLGRLSLVLGGGQRQDAAVNLRMQRLDATAENLGRPGVVAHLDGRDAELGEGFVGPAGREHFDFVLDQNLGQGFEVAFVGDADESSTDPGGHGAAIRLAPGTVNPRRPATSQAFGSPATD